MFCVLIFKTLGAGDPIILMIFMILGGRGGGGLKIMGACGWLFHGYVVWGVSGCELEFTVIDVSSGSLGRIHGEVRRE